MADWIAAEAAGAVLNALVVGSALVAALWLGLRLMRRVNATTRYAVWMAALAAVVSLPALVGRGAALGEAAGAAGAEALISLPAPGRWVIGVFAVWAMVSAAMLFRLVRAYVSLRGLKRRAQPAPSRCQEQFQRLCAIHGGRRRTRLCASDEVRAPIAAGLFEPAILIPPGLLEHLSDDELSQVLMHELAHLRRWDDWTCLAQKLAEALLFFHPAVLWIGWRMNLEREIACDDWVVLRTGAARPYAVCLTKLAELGRFSETPQLAPGAVARKRQISQRIELLLSRRRVGSVRLSAAGALAGVSALAAGLIFGTHTAPIAVAEPQLAALPVQAAAIPASAAAYAKPRAVPVLAAARRAKRAAPPAALAARRSAPAQYIVVEEVAVMDMNRLTTTYCVLYIGQVKPAALARPVQQLFTIFWTRPAPFKASPGQT